MEKYQGLAREIRRLWKTYANVIPIKAVASLDEYMSMLDIKRQSTVVCSIKKCKNTRKGVGYLRLGALTRCQPHSSIPAWKIKRSNNNNNNNDINNNNSNNKKVEAG